MSAGGAPVTVVASGGAPVTPVGLTASMVLATGGISVQTALNGKLAIASNLSDLANAATARGNLGIKQAYAVGNYYIPDGFAQYTASGVAPTANTLSLIPGYLHEATTIKSLALAVTTLAASGHVQIYVYAADATTGLPTGAPLISSAALSTASATTVEDNTVNTALARGLYWWGIICDTSAATAVFKAPNTSLTGFLQQSGSPTLANSLIGLIGYTKTATYGSPPTLTGNATTDSLTIQSTARFALVSFKAG